MTLEEVYKYILICGFSNKLKEIIC